MKKVIRLTENDIHRIVKNSVKRILKENIRDMQGSYYQLMQSIENFIGELDNHKDDFYPSDYKEAVNTLIETESKITNLFRHPDAGRDTMVWDNAGF